MTKRLLLISNSTSYGSGYLDHCADEIQDFLGTVKRVLFVPYALHDLEGYTTVARERFAQMGYHIDSVHESKQPKGAVQSAEALFIGGGNTFRLLYRLIEHDIAVDICERVGNGVPYVGTSAGSNVACATIKTTNDMPIVEPPTFDALDLVRFNINPHYLDPDPSSTHQGETREQRIQDFLEENDNLVIGLREGAWIRVEGAKATLGGKNGARLFARGREAIEFATGDSLDFLL